MGQPMEFQNDKLLSAKKVKVLLNVAVQKWWIIYGIGLAIIAIAQFGPRPPKATDEAVFYPWIMLREKAGELISILLVVVILGSVLYGMKKMFYLVPNNLQYIDK